VAISVCSETGAFRAAAWGWLFLPGLLNSVAGGRSVLSVSTGEGTCCEGVDEPVPFGSSGPRAMTS